MKFYKLNFIDDEYGSDEYGVAYTLEEGKKLSGLVQEKSLFCDSLPIFILKDGIPSDNLANNAGCRLFSKRLTDIIIQVASQEDLNNLWFIPSKVEYNNTKLDYNIVKFEKFENVLDEQLTKFIEPLHYPRVPILEKSKVHDRNIFVMDFSSIIIVSSKMKKFIEDKNILDVSFSPVKTN